MNKDKKDDGKECAPIRYTKAELLKSERYRHQTDLVEALLIEGNSYSFKETEHVISEFMKGKVN